MKKLLLLSFTFFAAASINAQSCTPGANFADSAYGAWPDTIQNFPPGAVGVPYSTDLNFKVPDAVTSTLDPTGAFVGSVIQEFTVTGVTGMPAGFNYVCGNGTCTYAGGSNGCANLYGTPTATGTYPLVINIDAVVIIELIPGLPTPVTQSTTFDGYKLVVGTSGLVEALIEPFSIHPNPASTKVTLNGLSEKLKISSITISNTEGKIIRSFDSVTGNSMDVDIDGFKSGIYVVTIQHELGSERLKFVKE